MARPSFSFIAALTAALGAAVMGVSSLTSLASCNDAETYLYFAQKYDPVGDCVNAYAPVETVNGSGAGAFCAPSCLTVGADLYVSTMCPPVPVIATSVPDDAGPCIAAIAARRRGGTCDNPGEGGADAAEAGGDDAGEDAGEDAAPAMDASDAAKPKDAGDAG